VAHEKTNVRMAKLIFLDEAFNGRTFNFLVEKNSVGRSDHNTLVIHHDSVSHQHCEILVNGGEVIVRDLGSKNGTFVEGQRLSHQQAQLKNGQTVRFGTVRARLELDPPEDGGDTATANTAVHALSKYERERRRKQKNPSGAAPSMELGPKADEDDQTVLLSRQDNPRSALRPEEHENLEVPPKKSPLRILAILAVVFVIGLAIVLWKLFKNS
jgi:predicted component of type VI protein secretion system